MPRFSSLAPLLPLALASLLAACTANLEDNCVTGPCGPETAPPRPTGSGAGGAGAGGAGGAGGADCSGTPDTGDLPCPVYEALKAKCQTCHTSPPTSAAPFPLLTFEDTRVLYGTTPRWQRMEVVIESGFMPFSNAPDLTPAERQTLLDWLRACAVPEPEGQGCDCNDPAACP